MFSRICQWLTQLVRNNSVYIICTPFYIYIITLRYIEIKLATSCTHWRQWSKKLSEVEFKYLNSFNFTKYFQRIFLSDILGVFWTSFMDIPYGKQQFSLKKGLTPLWYIAETAGLKILEEIEPGISKCTKGGAKFIFGNAFWHFAWSSSEPKSF